MSLWKSSPFFARARRSLASFSASALERVASVPVPSKAMRTWATWMRWGSGFASGMGSVLLHALDDMPAERALLGVVDRHVDRIDVERESDVAEGRNHVVAGELVGMRLLDSAVGHHIDAAA